MVITNNLTSSSIPTNKHGAYSNNTTTTSTQFSDILSSSLDKSTADISPKKIGVSNDQIRDALANNPNATPQQIFAAMQHYGVSMERLSNVTGLSPDNLATKALEGGITSSQLESIGYKSMPLSDTDSDLAAYQAWASSPESDNPFSSPAFQAKVRGELAQYPEAKPWYERIGEPGNVSAQNIHDWFSAPSIQIALVTANVNGISSKMIDQAMNWASGTAAEKAQQNGVSLVDMAGYAGTSNTIDMNNPMYDQYNQFLRNGSSTAIKA